MFYDITSTSNAKYKYIKSLMQKKARQKNGEFTVEGIKSVRDSVEAGWDISMIAVSDEFAETEVFDYPDGVSVYRIPKQIFTPLCDTETPQGIIAVLKMKKAGDFKADTDKVYIYCDSVSDPGNLGTIIRTADAAGIGGVLLSEGCTDIYAPKTIRATMGSFFHIDIYEKFSYEMLEKIKNTGFKIVSGALVDDSISHTQCDMTKPTVLVVGNEANGVSKAVLDMSDECVKIPIVGRAESLNVSIAAAVLMYEALRQRMDGKC